MAANKIITAMVTKAARRPHTFCLISSGQFEYVEKAEELGVTWASEICPFDSPSMDFLIAPIETYGLSLIFN